MVDTFLLLLLLLFRMLINYDSQLMEVTMTFANPAHLQVTCACKHSNEASFSITGIQFLDQLHDD
jgi:hypothetical protein